MCIASLLTGKSKSLLTNVILLLTRRTSNASERNRRGSEVHSDQEAWKSGGNSANTIDYFDLELSPGADVDFAERNNGCFEQQQQYYHSWRRKFMLRRRFNDSLNLNNGETRSSSPSESIAKSLSWIEESSFRCGATRQQHHGDDHLVAIGANQRDRKPSDSHLFCRRHTPEKENDDEEQAGPEFETENSSLPCSSAAASIVGLDFFHGALSWDHQHQLAPACEFASQRGLPADTCSSYGEDSSPSTDSLKPRGSCPNLERHSADCSSASRSSSPGPTGPCFKLFKDGDVQVCYLNQIRTFVKKILCSKFLRR
ncbi:C-Maf-inducing protein [Temnothorax longispinosus]|uniref:C-Maf-inducing protein n=1 Tax=Temnothorax longispinosus TaxID=300112 RepID=A0A4S2L8F4_9HYME|nr:C-Maf-inducing protein [Temnothorax longispinosus]